MILVALPVIFAVITLAFGVIYVLVDYVRILRLRQRMAPGPLPLPLFGNIFHIPSSRQWMKFEEWSLKYQSTIITIWDGHTPVVICNDAWSMSDLGDKRANIFSSRPVKTLTGKIFGLNKFNQAGLAYGEQWRVHRRLTHSAANAQMIQAYRPSQANEAKLLIEDCLTKPDRFVDSALRFTVSIISIIAWGRRIGTESDTVLKVASAYVGSANLGFLGKTYTEAIPALADIKVEISNLTGNFIGAGVDTTTSTMLTFVLAMCLNQDVQSKAYEEIDRIIGRDRCPDWSDEDSLPYLAAVINETLRWRPAFALGGPPHAPIEDDIYNGFFFPRGTSIIGNLYATHRNPGEALAQQSLYFTIVSLLWAFEIRPGLDEKGNEVALDLDAYTVSQVNRPLPFKVRFIPRSETIADLVRSGAEEARTQLQAYDAVTNVTFESAQSVSLGMPIAQADNGSAV
ncbi:cytochrome P450 [Colletotrichum salicis]|uniref:Cytochrome P450 n=1 Tax=Colletotrichum salicis TaxID=1209931 RepID=A0A135V995_9PEZI|nr:cytochrome P450 [Colletotrichum salicis]